MPPEELARHNMDALITKCGWLIQLRDTVQLRHLKIDSRTLQEITRLLDEANQLVAITVASRKTARGHND